ncbi:664_t:CDS:2, partial [Entrophospora sp. SA101]
PEPKNVELAARYGISQGQFSNPQSGGTYVTDIIVPVIQAVLKTSKEDEVKLWREINDGLYWAHRGCKMDDDEFGVIGIQVGGQKLHLYVLIRDDDEINRLFLLRSVDIPTQYLDGDCVFRFVETLLFLQ